MGKMTKKKKLTHLQEEIEITKNVDEQEVIQTRVNSKNNNAQIQDNPQEVEDIELQPVGTSEAVMERDQNLIQDIDANSIARKTRGPTLVKRLPSDPLNKIEVEFNAEAEPIEEGLVKLSSYLGPLVREHVPVTLNDWRQLSDELKVVLWKCIQARFKLDEEWQKVPIFQQMGTIWRASKSRLVREIRNAKNEEERLQLKPDNIKSMKEWKKFVKSKTSSNFEAISEKFKAIRRKQIPHTCSRKGMTRLAEDMKKKSVDCSSVSRAQVWIKSRTRKNGEPVNLDVIDTIEKIKNYENGSQSCSVTNYKEDALSLALGPDRPGRLRAMGRGMTLTRAVLAHVRDKQAVQFQNEISELKKMVHMLIKKQGNNESWAEASTPQTKYGKKLNKCDLLHWTGVDEVVAEGRVVSNDPSELVNNIPLGPDAMKILVDIPRKPEVYLWRPTSSCTHIGEAKDDVVAWPASRVILHTMENFEKEDNVSNTSSTNCKCKIYHWNGSKELVAEGRLHSSDPNELVNDFPLGPSAVVVWIDDPKNRDVFLWRPSVGMTCVGDAVGSKVAWVESEIVVEKVSTATSSIPNRAASTMTANSRTKNRCKLIDFEGNKEIVAEGHVLPSDPNTKVHFFPLGKDAVRVVVDVAKVKDARLWRPTSALQNIEDAVGSIIAWPTANVIME